MSVKLPDSYGKWQVSMFATNPLGYSPPTSISYLVPNDVSCSLPVATSNEPFLMSVNFPIGVSSVSANLSIGSSVFTPTQAIIQTGYGSWSTNVSSSNALVTRLDATISASNGSCTVSNKCSNAFIDCSPEIPLGSIVHNSNISIVDMPTAPIVISSGVTGSASLSFSC
jgi:hypothetical protein